MAIAVERPAPEAAQAEQSIELLDLKSITPAPDNPRRDVGDVTELAQSMNELGLLQPLVVTPRAGKFMVVCGHRRYAAAQLAELGRVPSIVRELTEPQRIKAMLIENCQRTDLAPLEEARAYEALVGLGMSQREIAGDVGKGQSHISKRLSLLELPGNVLKVIDSGGITIADALELLKLKEHPDRLGLAFRDRGKWHDGITQTVGKQLRELETEQRIAAGEAKLVKQGVTILQYRKGSYHDEPPKGAIEVRKDASWGAVFDLDPKEHAKHDCHAAAVSREGTIVYFCTDRKNHPKLKTADEKRGSGTARRTKSDALAKHEKEIRSARTARFEFVHGLLAKPPAKSDLVDVLVFALIRECWQSKRKLACELMGLDAEKFTSQAMKPTSTGYHDMWELALQDEAAKRGRAIAVGLALVLACEEETIHKAWDGWKKHAPHFEFLAQHGYEISPAEKRELAGRRPR